MQRETSAFWLPDSLQGIKKLSNSPYYRQFSFKNITKKRLLKQLYTPLRFCKTTIHVWGWSASRIDNRLHDLWLNFDRIPNGILAEIFPRLFHDEAPMCFPWGLSLPKCGIQAALIVFPRVVDTLVQNHAVRWIHWKASLILDARCRGRWWSQAHS